MPLNNIKVTRCHVVFRRIKQKEEVKCELYIEYDNDLFDYLYNQKDAFESKCNMSFNWISDDNYKHSKIEAVYNINTDEKSNWQKATDWQLNMAEIFSKAFSDEIIKFYKNYY